MQPATRRVVMAWSENLLRPPPRQACGELKSILAFGAKRRDGSEVTTLARAAKYLLHVLAESFGGLMLSHNRRCVVHIRSLRIRPIRQVTHFASLNRVLA
jgi:hypothetical protein